MSIVVTPPERGVVPPPAASEPSPGRLAAWLVRWRLALRLARRDARRAKGRTVLVLLMVGLPVMAIVGGDTLLRTNEMSAVEALPSRLGSADARIEGVSRERIWSDPVSGEALTVETELEAPWTAAEVRDLLPAGTHLVEQRRGMLAFRTGIGYATVEAFAEDLADPLRGGSYEVIDGRSPLRDGEVAISEAVAERGIEVGDVMRLTRDDVSARVVGVLDSAWLGAAPFLVLPPEAGDLLDFPFTSFFAEVPGGLDWAAVRELNERGLAVQSREVVLDPPDPAEYEPPGYHGGVGMGAAEVAVIALVVAALLLEVVLLAGPAFAVGLRRQRRDLALLAATGAGAADLRRAVLASGLLLGGGAAVIGALAGVGAARGAVPLLESWGAGLGPFEVSPLTVGVVVAVGALAGLAAAYVPARQAARTDVVTTLTGRRGQVRSSWRLPVLGLAVVGLGLVLTVMGARGTELAVAGGAVLLVVGVVLATPWLVGLLAPLAPRLPVAGRLAVRDATRNRTRTAPAVAAVMATVAGVTAMAIGSASDSAQGRRDYVPQAAMGTASVSVYDADQEGWASVVRTIEQRLPGQPIGEIRGTAYVSPDSPSLQVTIPDCVRPVDECGWYPNQDGGFSTVLGDVVVAEAAAVAGTVPDAARADLVAALESGRAVVFGTGALDASGGLRLDAVRYSEAGSEALGSVVLPAVEIAPPTRASGMPTAPATVVVPPGLADELPVETAVTQVLVGSPEDPLTDAEETTLRESITALSSESSVHVERGWSDQLWVARLLLLAVGSVLVLVATLTATGLAVADARPDHATLAAVGAAPRTRRLMAMGSAAVIGGLGASLGVLAGLAPGISVAYPLTSDDYGSGAQPLVVVPWDLLAAVAVGVPLLAVLGTGLVVRSQLLMATRIAD